MNDFVIKLSEETRAGLSLALDTELVCEEAPIKMAWIFFVLKEIPDNAVWFPKGKWATLQNIESQLESAAISRALELMKEG